jgi:hypothetical protein
MAVLLRVDRSTPDVAVEQRYDAREERNRHADVFSRKRLVLDLHFNKNRIAKAVLQKSL